MGIIDDNTRRLLRDGRILRAMHKMASRQPTGRGVKVEVAVPNRDGKKTVQVIVRRVANNG